MWKGEIMDTNRIDWTTKGLGWIPDLPTISDTSGSTSIEEPGKLEAEETTDAVVQLTTQFLNLINQLAGQPAQDDKWSQIRQEVSSLKERLTEDISFLDVQFYKVLRRGQTNQSREAIINLKRAFCKLYHKEKGKESKDKLNKFVEAVDKIIEFESDTLNPIVVENESEWLAQGEFDDDLEMIVEAFQEDIKEEKKRKNINFIVDGIVGLRTMLEIEERLQGKSSQQVEYLPIPPIIPDEILELGFSYLGLLWLKSRLKSEFNEAQIRERIDDYFLVNETRITALFTKNQKNGKKDLDIATLRNEIDRIAEYLSTFEQHRNFPIEAYIYNSNLDSTTVVPVDVHTISGERLFTVLFGEGEGLSNHFSLENVIKRFRSQFHIVEPLVAALYLVASPFSGYANPRTAIDSSFKLLENYFEPGFLQKSALYEPFATLYQEYSGQNILSNFEDSKREQFGLMKLVFGAVTKMYRVKQENTLPDQSSRLDGVRKEILEWQNMLERKKLFDKLIASTGGSPYPISLKYVQDKIESLEKLIEAAEATKQFLSFIQEVLGDSIQKMLDYLQWSFSSDINNGESKEKIDYYSQLYNKQEIFCVPALKAGLEHSSSVQQLSSFLSPISLKLPINVASIKQCFDLNSAKNYYFFLPDVVDLSLWCSPVKDQKSLNTCTIFSGIALIEYWFQKEFGRREDLSALFLYKTARDLMQRSGDTGVSAQATMQAMALFGVPPEDYWPYQEDRLDDVPPTFCYAYAQNYQSLKYFRLDSAEVSADKQLLMLKIRATLAAGIPCMFGLTLYSSVYHERNTSRGRIPYPSDRDTIIGGHTLVAVGYNDRKELEQASGIPSTSGALLVRNSWGAEWGKQGYGWLPYDYVLQGLTSDWWSVTKAEWFDRRTLGLGARKPGGVDWYSTSTKK